MYRNFAPKREQPGNSPRRKLGTKLNCHFTRAASRTTRVPSRGDLRGKANACARRRASGRNAGPMPIEPKVPQNFRCRRT